MNKLLNILENSLDNRVCLFLKQHMDLSLIFKLEVLVELFLIKPAKKIANYLDFQVAKKIFKRILPNINKR